MAEEEFMDSELGYRMDYEGIGVFVFRHPQRDGKWFVMTMQNQGTRSALKVENEIQSAMRKDNNCEIDMESGVQSGIRIELVDNKVRTFVKDSDDVSYRECTVLPRYKPW